MKTIRLLDFFNMYRRGSPHHMAAVQMLQQLLPVEALDKEADWVACFMAATSEEIE